MRSHLVGADLCAQLLQLFLRLPLGVVQPVHRRTLADVLPSQHRLEIRSALVNALREDPDDRVAPEGDAAGDDGEALATTVDNPMLRRLPAPGVVLFSVGAAAPQPTPPPPRRGCCGSAKCCRSVVVGGKSEPHTTTQSDSARAPSSAPRGPAPAPSFYSQMGYFGRMLLEPGVVGVGFPVL